MILVTGGTGLVGAHLLYQLTQDNEQVKAIYRSEEKLALVKKVFSYYTNNVDNAFVKITWVKADITDVPSLEAIFNNVTYVYHAAALVSFDPKDYFAMRKVNIEGTANIVNLCIDYNIKKLCFVSSIAAVGDSVNGKLITEEDEWVDTKDQHGYAITKYGAEMEVWRGSQEGLDVVIVNPGVILGSGFWKDGSGKLFSQIYNGFKFYTEGVTGFISVKDVVKAMVLLMHSEIKNERYILVSENVSFKELFFNIADTFNKKRPNIKVGKIITGIFWRLDACLTFITGKKPLLTKNSAKSSHNKSYYSNNKIKTALNIEFKTVLDTVKETCTEFTA